MSISYLFSECSSLNEIDVSYLDTAKVQALNDLPSEGAITYNSEKCSNIVNMISEKWTKNNKAK